MCVYVCEQQLTKECVRVGLMEREREREREREARYVLVQMARQFTCTDMLDNYYINMYIKLYMYNYAILFAAIFLHYYDHQTYYRSIQCNYI